MANPPKTPKSKSNSLPMDQLKRDRVRSNLFEASREAVGPWDEFPWHTGESKLCDTWKRHSSQALAIDVFGTIKMASQLERDTIMDWLATQMGMATDSPWQIELEWGHPENTLQEETPTQVDVKASGQRNVILMECKLGESDGGSCSQPKQLGRGAHQGMKQCNGNYEPQTNPVNGRSTSCALTGKGIRYWEVIPQVLHVKADTTHARCPFVGGWYQWMRNLVVAHETANREVLNAGVAFVYADDPRLPMAKKIRSGEWQKFAGLIKQEHVRCRSISYQELLREAVRTLGQGNDAAGKWVALERWVLEKIEATADEARSSTKDGRPRR